MANLDPPLLSSPGREDRPSASNPSAPTGVSTVLAAADWDAELPPDLPGAAEERPCARVRLYTPVPMAARTSRTTRTMASRVTSGRLSCPRGGGNTPPPPPPPPGVPPAVPG